MPKYRFTTVSGDKLDLNPSWIDFPIDEAASRDAQRALAEMANDQLPDGSHFELRIAVENQAVRWSIKRPWIFTARPLKRCGRTPTRLIALR